MPSDVKGILSAIVLIVAAVLAYWSGSPIRHDFSTFVMIVARLDGRGDVGLSRGRRQKGRRRSGPNKCAHARPSDGHDAVPQKLTPPL